MTMDKSLGVPLSVISTSCAVERLKDIIALLESIQAQTHNNIEMVFVVERSKELFEHIKIYIKKRNLFNVKLIFDERRMGVSESRNLGIRNAKGDFLAFVNDDVILPPEWGEEIVKTFAADGSIIGLTGPTLPLWEDRFPEWFPEELYWIISCTAWFGPDKMRKVRNAWGMNMAFRKEVFNQCGYFPTAFGPIKWQKGSMLSGELSAEEVVFSLNAKRQTGKNIVFNPKLKVRHKVQSYRLTYDSIIRKSFQIGRERRMLKRFYPDCDKDVDTLGMEDALLLRILGKLLPSIAKGLFKKPSIALRQLRVTLISMFFVGVGYLSSVNPGCQK